MDTSNNSADSAALVTECEEIVQKLKQDPPSVPAGQRLFLRISNPLLTVYFSWQAWNECVAVGPDGKRVLSLLGAIFLVAAYGMLFSTIREFWLPPKDRLLLLLAEDFLARRKAAAPPAAPLS